jgi:hypothetical protein
MPAKNYFKALLKIDLYLCGQNPYYSEQNKYENYFFSADALL